MKKLAGILIFISVLGGLSAQIKPERAPLNPEFIKYLEDNKIPDEKKSTGDKGYGYFPSPMHIHFDQNEVLNDSKKSGTSLPVRYDLRDDNMVTDYGIGRDSVKDQGPVGACWTFSTIGAIESNWLKLGKSYIDLSEQNMATCHGFVAGIDDGGNDMFALAYLTRLSGPVTEESHPYNPDPASTCKTTDLVIPAYVRTAYQFPKDRNLVKKAIMDYGAISASIHMGMYTRYLSRSNHTYCYVGNEPVDHAVLIIGWDDSITVTGNPTYSPPASKGAWIVKNSWGTTFANKGYFYVGYNDSKFLSSGICFPERAEINEMDTLYMYDKLGAITSFGFRQETAIGLVKYSAPKEHFIKQVGTFLNSYSSFVDIEIYSNFQGDTLLTGLIASSYNNHRQFPGYHTFDIPAMVNGDFYVKIKYNTPGYNYPIPAEVAVPPVAIPVIEEAGKFWISRDGDDWMALGQSIEDMDGDLTIRVYAERNIEFQPYFTTDKNLTCSGSTVTFTNASKGTISGYTWNFGVDAVPQTASGAGPHEVIWTTPGYKTISLTATGGNDSGKTVTRVKFINVVSELDVILPFYEKTIVNRKSLTIYAAGAEEYTWTPVTGLNTSTGQVVIASPNENTTYTVSGTLGSCTGSASIKISVLPNPPYDDVCDARQLNTTGFQGPFTNNNSTVQPGEPAPPEGDCKTPLEWCEEGGLQNSVWFWFYGPETGIVSIDTEGMDNQIAVYKADHCDSIFSPTGHQLIAAFDDYYDEDKFFAAALEKVTVIHNQKYFLQVDGSAGGTEGYFTITMSEYPISTERIAVKPNGLSELLIYPNPAEDVLFIRFNNIQNRPVIVKLYDLTGQIVHIELKDMAGSSETSLNLSKLNSGLYLMELYDHDNIHRQTIIIK